MSVKPVAIQSTLKDGFEEMKQDALDEAISIVDALQEYSGY
ncbi:hypothetical protein [Enterobacter cloacae complex sp. 2024EL-00227]